MDRIDVHGSYIYHLIKDDKVVYVGQSSKLVYRLSCHRSDKEKDFDFIDLFKVKAKDLTVTEFIDIVKHNPKLNKTLPSLYFAIYETRVKQVNKCLDDSGISFEKYDIKNPDISVKLNGRNYNLWAKRGLQDVFYSQLECLCNDTQYLLSNKVNRDRLLASIAEYEGD